jgi:DNA-binding response OmpR family regulator
MSSSSVRVLIVDDDPNYRAYLAALARKVGLEVEMASDGEDAFRKLCNRQFELLLSDYEMPRRNGLELIKAVRVEESLLSLYAVMLTAHDDVALKIEALTLGYDDFLPKN